MEKDFFISYNRADREWAEWTAWQLEDAGYTTVLQAWDFGPGTNFALKMHEASAQAERTIALLSPEYLTSGFAASEWAEAFAGDPTGERGLLVPVRVRACDPDGLLGQIVYIDLVSLDGGSARERLLSGVQRRRAKPSREPGFPGRPSSPVEARPHFPGSDSGEATSHALTSTSRIPKWNQAPPDSGSADNAVPFGGLPSTDEPPVTQRGGKRFRPTARSLWSGLSALGKALTALGGLGGIAALLTALYQMGLLPFGPDPDPSVAIANAALREVRSTEEGEVLDIAYDITMTNMEGDSVIVRALLLEDKSRQEAHSLSAPSQQQVTAESADDSGEGSIAVPLPLAAGCVVVRVEVFEEDGDRVDEAETPAFDPHDTENPACPGGGTSTVEEVAA